MCNQRIENSACVWECHSREPRCLLLDRVRHALAAGGCQAKQPYSTALPWHYTPEAFLVSLLAPLFFNGPGSERSVSIEISSSHLFVAILDPAWSSGFFYIFTAGVSMGFPWGFHLRVSLEQLVDVFFVWALRVEASHVQHKKSMFPCPSTVPAFYPAEVSESLGVL